MKQPNIFFLVALALTFGSGVAHNAVNCASVMRNLKAGASPQEVADTMAISLADVKDRQDRDKLDSAGDSGTVLERCCAAGWGRHGADRVKAGDLGRRAMLGDPCVGQRTHSA